MHHHTGSLPARAAALLLAGALAGCAVAPAGPRMAAGQPAEQRNAAPASTLFIGNSFFYYNNGIIAHVKRFAEGGTGGASHRTTMATISGGGFDTHDVASYFRPDAIGRYAFTASNEVVFNRLDKLFDVAVLNDCSQCPIHPRLRQQSQEFARRHADTVRRHGARPVFFMTWAYQDAPEMTDALAEAYTRMGTENRAQVIPAGLAFRQSLRLRPDVNLYDPDKRHPSMAGTYLAAATSYATLFRRSPVGHPYTAGLSPSVAAHLQSVAWTTVQEYEARNGTP